MWDQFSSLFKNYVFQRIIHHPIEKKFVLTSTFLFSIDLINDSRKGEYLFVLALRLQKIIFLHKSSGGGS